MAALDVSGLTPLDPAGLTELTDITRDDKAFDTSGLKALDTSGLAEYSPPLTDYPIELGKSAVEGAKNLPGTALKGFAATLNENPARFRRGALDVLERVDRGAPVADMEDTYGFQHMTPEQRAAMRPEIERYAAVPAQKVTENPLFKAGVAIEDFGKETLGPRPGFEGQTWTRDIGSGFGSVGAGIVTSMLNPAAAMLMWVAAGSGEAAERAVKAGATPEQIELAAKLGSGPGATDALDGLLPMLGSYGKAVGFIKRVGLAAVVGAITEGGQEGLQQFLQNAIARGIYKPDQDLWEDVGRNAAVGAIVGGVTAGGFSAAEGRHQPAAQPSSQPVPAGAVAAETLMPGPGALSPGNVSTPDIVSRETTSPAAPLASPPVSVPGAGLEAAPIPAAAQAAPVDTAGMYPAAVDPGASVPVGDPAGRATLKKLFDDPRTADEIRAEIKSAEADNEAAAYWRGTADWQEIPTRWLENEHFNGRKGTDALEIQRNGDKARVRLLPEPGTRAAPVQLEAAPDVHLGAERTADPTPAQAEAGNYAKRHVKWNGLDIAIETEAGQNRTGIGADGIPWSHTLSHPYGYIKRTVGKDGDQVDLYLGPDPSSPRVFVFDQVDPDTRKFDEHKIVVGARTVTEAQSVYEAGFNDNSAQHRWGSVTEMSVPEFKAWLENGNTKKPVAYTPPKPAPAPRERAPLSLFQFLASKGGIRDEGGELRSLDLHNKFIPGYGRLVRSTGMPLDRAREAAVEAGYLADAPALEAAASGGMQMRPSESTIGHLLAALSAEARGERVYSARDRDVATRRQEKADSKEQTARAKEIEADVREHAKRIKVARLTDEEVRATVEDVLVNGADIDEALAAVIERSAYASHDDLVSSDTREGSNEQAAAIDTTRADQDGAGSAPSRELATRPQSEPEAGSPPHGEQPGGAEPAGRGEQRASEPAGSGGERVDLKVNTAPADDLEIPDFLRRPKGEQAAPAQPTQISNSAQTENEPESSGQPAATTESTPTFEPAQAPVSPDAQAVKTTESAIRQEADKRWRNWIPSKETRADGATRPRLGTFIKQVRKEVRLAEREAAKQRVEQEKIAAKADARQARADAHARKAAAEATKQAENAPAVATPTNETVKSDVTAPAASEVKQSGQINESVNAKNATDVALPLAPSSAGEETFTAPDDEMFALRDVAAPFYSAVTRAVEGMKLGKAPAVQWLNTIKNTQGVKQEELDWLGLGDWLKEQQGAVTREQVLDYVRANQISVQEVHKGGSEVRKPTMQERAAVLAWVQQHQSDQRRNAADFMDDAIAGDHGQIGNLEALGIPDELLTPFRRMVDPIALRLQDINTRLEEIQDEFNMLHGERESEQLSRRRADLAREQARLKDDRESALHRQEMEERGRERTAPRHGQWQLPGGKNYGNLLLTLPVRPKPVKTEDTTGWTVETLGSNDFTGQRHVLVRNAQSHTVGQRSGFRGTDAEAIREFAERGRENAAKIAEGEATFQYTAHWSEPNVLASVRFNDRTIDGKRTLFLEEVQSDWHQQGRKKGYRKPGDPPPGPRGWGDTQGGTAGGIPDAPFKTTWPELAMKRMIRYAAENGYDAIAWTPGEVQADRYDLSKHIDDLHVHRFGKDQFVLGGNKDGIEVLNTTVTADKLAETVGKDLADKITEMRPDEATTFKGVDLRVGGQGMIGFYDKILPAAVNKLVKKFGAKVEQRSLSVVEPAGRDMQIERRGGNFDVVEADSGILVERFPNREMAEAYMAAEQPAAPRSDNVHTLAITAAMREAAVNEGFPLFKSRHASDVTPQFAEYADTVAPILRSELDRIGLKHVALALEDRIERMVGGKLATADGAYLQGVITVALDTGNKFQTLHHEALHGMRRLGLFTPGEWSILSRASNAKWRSEHDIGRRYGAWPEWVQVEEGVAHAYADWEGQGAGSKRGVTDGRVARLFKRIRDFLERLGSALRLQGFQNAEDIFRSIDKGEIGARDGTRIKNGIAAYAVRSGDGGLFKTEIVNTPDGPREQTVIPGAEKISQREQLERQGNARKRSNKTQKGTGDLPLFKEPDKQGEMFALRREPETTTDRTNAMQGFLARGQYIDRAIRMPFDFFGGTTRDGQWKPGIKLFDKAANIITGAKFSSNGRFAFMNPMMETVRAGLVDRYGLDPKYVERERGRALDERAVMVQGAEVLRSLKDHAVGPAEARVLQAILTGENVSDADMGALAEPIRNAIDNLGMEAVALGLVSPESFERNRGTYLHRVYQKHEVDQNGLARMVGNIMGSRRKKIIGNQFKGRGLFEEVAVGRLMQDVPGWIEAGRGVPENGERFVVLDEMPRQSQLALNEDATAERPLRRIYWPAGEAIPDRYDNFTNRGTWEVRGKKNGKLTIWRDFTKAERVQMGEILDARYTIGKTFMLMAHDLSVGKFYKDIAENEEWSSTQPPAGEWIEAADWSAQGRRLVKRNDIAWVRVPDQDLPGTGGKKRWGALSGKWVREEIWRDLNELSIMNRPGVWRTLLTQWKLNKTARSPVVHMNNVISNFLLMDMMDVRFQDLVGGIRSYLAGDQHYQEAMQHGAFGADAMSQEVRDQVLRPILEELARGNTFQQGGNLGALGQVSKFTEALWSKLKLVDQKMIDAYRAEDELFRMATYIRRRELGDDAKQAADVAREQFIDYDIRAPWVNMARNTVLPFISYTYRAAPLVAKAVATRPWKLAKYFMLAYGLNALAYALTGGDEDKERRSLREREQGRTWIGAPQMMRMPLNDRHGNPIFLDINRWMPGGDIFDTNGSDWPAWLNLGGPLMIGTELFLNRAAFTGQEIVNTKIDNLGDRLGKRADHLYKSWMPSAAYVPGSWYWESVGNAVKGATDRQGRPNSVPLALSQSVGIKLKPQDVADALAAKGMEFNRIERELEAEANRIASRHQRKIISDAEFNKAMRRIIDKQKKLSEKASGTLK